VTVRGVVTKTLRHNSLYGGATLDVADMPASETGVTVIIPDEDRGKFPPADFYLGQTICAAGLIGGYQPAVMVVEFPDRLALLVRE
jgi:hypothetical protein